MLSRPPNSRCDQSCADLQSCLLQFPADSRALEETAGVFYTSCLSKAGGVVLVEEVALKLTAPPEQARRAGAIAV